MENKILLAYATRKGSTQETAAAIAAEMLAAGFDVDIQPCRKVKTLAGYSAVILGAPLYMFRWHKDAINFLLRHRESLATLPVAVFAAGPIDPKQENGLQEARQHLDQELAHLPWFQPKTIKIFGGSYHPEQWSFPYTLFMKGFPANDLRDWEQIRAWARQVVVELQTAATENA